MFWHGVKRSNDEKGWIRAFSLRWRGGPGACARQRRALLESHRSTGPGPPIMSYVFSHPLST